MKRLFSEFQSGGICNKMTIYKMQDSSFPTGSMMYFTYEQ